MGFFAHKPFITMKPSFVEGASYWIQWFKELTPLHQNLKLGECLDQQTHSNHKVCAQRSSFSMAHLHDLVEASTCGHSGFSNHQGVTGNFLCGMLYVPTRILFASVFLEVANQNARFQPTSRNKTARTESSMFWFAHTIEHISCSAKMQSNALVFRDLSKPQ